VIAGVFLLILVPLLAAGVLAVLVYVIHRLEPLVALIAAGVAAALGGLALIAPLDRPILLGGRQVVLGEPVTLLGRQLVLRDADRVVLAFLFLVTALLFIHAWRTRTGRAFYPLGLMTLGILCAALVVRPFLYSALLLTVAAALTTMLLQSEEWMDTLGALRFLFMVALAMLAFLVAGWQIDQYTLNPDDQGLARTVAISLAIGFSLLLSVVPFHTWLASVARHAQAVGAAFLFTVFNTAIWFLLFDVLQEYPWLLQQPGFFTTLQVLGILTAVVGGLGAFASYDFGRVMAYGLLANWGCALLTLGLGTQDSLGAVILGLFLRPASLMILALGLASARQRANTIDFPDLVGLARNSPWTSLALVTGSLSLAGVPPFPGFLARWIEVRLLAQHTHITAALIVLLVTLGVATAALRSLDFLVARPRDLHPDDPRHRPEPRGLVLLVAGGLLTSLAVVAFPALFDSSLRAVMASYTFLGS
jgi:formate hydrogenlyase subunit 3/multisubunit Na+/H+ antiporter MnhD subunit